MIEIARETNNHGILQKDIAERQNISIKYLDQIILNLKTAGLVSNVHGKKSGYKLAKLPEEISLLDIYRAFEPVIQIIDCLGSHYVCNKEEYCAAKSVWSGLNKVIFDYFNSYTLADILTHQIKLEEVAGL